jgi:hypothetical protein
MKMFFEDEPEKVYVCRSKWASRLPMEEAKEVVFFTHIFFRPKLMKGIMSWC